MSVQQISAEMGALRELEEFPLVEALFGRRSRRFALGGEIPDGPLAYRSGQEPVRLSELERMLVLGAMGGTTGWHFSITRHARYAPQRSIDLRKGGQRHAPLVNQSSNRRLRALRSRVRQRCTCCDGQ